MAWASVTVAGVSAGVSLYKGLRAEHQDKLAQQDAANLRRPFYQIPSEDVQIENLAAQQATGGFTTAEKNYQQDQRERGLTTSLSALKQAGGASPNDFAGLDQVFNSSLRSEAAEDANRHLQNISFFTQAAKDVAAQKTIQWGVNEKEPFETALNEINQRRIAAKTNENNAADELIGSLSAAATGVNSYMKTRGAAPAPTDPTPYNRTFGLADTGGGGGGSPSAGIGSIDPSPTFGGVQVDSLGFPLQPFNQ